MKLLILSLACWYIIFTIVGTLVHANEQFVLDHLKFLHFYIPHNSKYYKIIKINSWKDKVPSWNEHFNKSKVEEKKLDYFKRFRNELLYGLTVHRLVWIGVIVIGLLFGKQAGVYNLIIYIVFLIIFDSILMYNLSRINQIIKNNGGNE